MGALPYKTILKEVGIRGVKSYFQLYNTKTNVFAFASKDSVDSAWYCEIKESGEIIINTKYYSIPPKVIEYNKSLQL
jgi:hypothetical protein